MKNNILALRKNWKILLFGSFVQSLKWVWEHTTCMLLVLFNHLLHRNSPFLRFHYQHVPTRFHFSLASRRVLLNPFVFALKRWLIRSDKTLDDSYLRWYVTGRGLLWSIIHKAAAVLHVATRRERLNSSSSALSNTLCMKSAEMQRLCMFFYLVCITNTVSPTHLKSASLSYYYIFMTKIKY